MFDSRPGDQLPLVTNLGMSFNRQDAALLRRSWEFESPRASSTRGAHLVGGPHSSMLSAVATAVGPAPIRPS